jgi:hypothetical protein
MRLVATKDGDRGFEFRISAIGHFPAAWSLPDTGIT